MNENVTTIVEQLNKITKAIEYIEDPHYIQYIEHNINMANSFVDIIKNILTGNQDNNTISTIKKEIFKNINDITKSLNYIKIVHDVYHNLHHDSNTPATYVATIKTHIQNIHANVEFSLREIDRILMQHMKQRPSFISRVKTAVTRKPYSKMNPGGKRSRS